jgi:biopolymer transport protein ExbD
MQQELMNDTSPASIHACHPSAWIQSEIFTQWFLHFIRHTEPTKKYPVILAPDGHYSHTTIMEVTALARENHVDIIFLPPPLSQLPQNATLL